MRAVWMVVLTLLPLAVAGQMTISGRVVDSGTGEGLPYATVAVPGREMGVVTDRDGRFELRGSEGLTSTDTVVFSHVGFNTETRTAGEFTGGEHDIALRRGEYPIEQITVTNRRSRLAKLGHSSAGTRMLSTPFFTRDDVESGVREGREKGTVINIRHDSEILSLAFLINRNGYDNARFRVSFYAMEGERPGELLVNRDITFDIAGGAKDWFELDLTPYSIWLSGGERVLVTLTMLDELGSEAADYFFLNGALLSGKGLYQRRAGSPEWVRMGGVTISMYLNARIYL